jgi:Tol biopolymer transport system component
MERRFIIGRHRAWPGYVAAAPGIILVVLIGLALFSIQPAVGEGTVTQASKDRSSAEGRPAAAPIKTKVESLSPIPDWASLILAAPWAGTKSPDGFPSNELYAADDGGTKAVQITHHAKLYNHFAVSPDRQKIAAVRYAGDSNRDGRIDFRDRKTIWIMDLANKEEWPLVPEVDAGWGGVDWFPDSRTVCFSMLKEGKIDVHSIHIDGTGLTNLTEGVELKLGAKQPGKWVSDVGVSPDGLWIAFLYAPWTGPGPFDFLKKNVIAIMRVDRSEARIVTDGGPLAPGQHGPWAAGDFDPEFSPDGQWLCFQRATDTATNWGGIASHDIMVERVDGTGLKRLSPGGNTGVHGISDWSEDGRIVFSEWNQKDNYVGPVMVFPDGTGYHRLSGLKFGGSHVRWIPPAKK